MAEQSQGRSLTMGDRSVLIHRRDQTATLNRGAFHEEDP
jgi:hypothetical protein